MYPEATTREFALCMGAPLLNQAVFGQWSGGTPTVNDNNHSASILPFCNYTVSISTSAEGDCGSARLWSTCR
jgi:hypothetical protein